MPDRARRLQAPAHRMGRKSRPRQHPPAPDHLIHEVMLSTAHAAPGTLAVRRWRVPPGSRAGLSPPPITGVTSCFSRQDRLLTAPECEPGRRGDVMSGLPERPDLDQLRRQARELLRAGANGEPRAVDRLRAVSPYVTLSAAQLALAREYGFQSWAALKAEVTRRRSSAAPAERWSFGGAATLQTPGGVLLPEILIAGAGH